MACCRSARREGGRRAAFERGHRTSRIDVDLQSTHGRPATADGAYSLNRRIVMNEELMLVDLGDATEETKGKVGPERDSFQLPDIEPLG